MVLLSKATGAGEPERKWGDVKQVDDKGKAPIEPERAEKKALIYGPVLTGVRVRRPGLWLQRTGRGIYAHRGGSFPIAYGACVCLSPLKWQFRFVELRNHFDTCGVGSNRTAAKKKPPPYLGATRQEPSPSSGHSISK